jgi:hypothetical protein
LCPIGQWVGAMQAYNGAVNCMLDDAHHQFGCTASPGVQSGFGGRAPVSAACFSSPFGRRLLPAGTFHNGVDLF